MAVFRYKAMKAERGEFVESDIVVAKDKHKAKSKLREHGFGPIQLQQLHGIKTLLKRFSADIK